MQLLYGNMIIKVNIFALFYKANPDSAYGLDRAEEYREN
jgi:hypothetical protein